MSEVRRRHAIPKLRLRLPPNAGLAEFLICKDLSQCSLLQNEQIRNLSGIFRNTIYEIRSTKLIAYRKYIKRLIIDK